MWRLLRRLLFGKTLNGALARKRRKMLALLSAPERS